MARIAIYSRKSKYTGKGESIENQIEMCRNYILAHIPGTCDEDITIYEDEGFSAKNLDRPQFQKMLKDAGKAPFDYVVCYRLDRISRSVSDFSALIEDLSRRQTAFICIKEQFDTSTPMGRAMMYIASVFAQLERETIAERVRDNMLMLARTGRWLGGTTPTGFASEKVEELIIDGKVKSSCKLKWHPDEIKTVKTIYEQFMDSHSISGVSKYLIKNNIRSRNGQYFSLPGIKEILANPVYCIADQSARDYFLAKGSDVCFEENQCSDKAGLLSYNKRNYTKKNAPRHDESQWIIAIGKHKGIVSGKDWAKIQKILAEKKSKSSSVKTHNNYSLLSGMISCGECGARLFAKNRHSGKAPFDYICGSKMRGGTRLCGCPNLNGRQTDDLVWNSLRVYISDNPNLYPLLEELKAKLQKQGDNTFLAELVSRIKRCEEDTERYLAALTQPHVSQVLLEKINAKILELHENMEVLSTKKAELEEASRTPRDTSQQERLIYALSYWQDTWQDPDNDDRKNPQHQIGHADANRNASPISRNLGLSVYEKQELLRLLIDKIQWDGEEFHIFLSG